ncbi:MAG TPA: GTPase ObgE [Planctomycetaceae bacterium]
MFVDQVTIECRAGDGGAGCISFRREAHVPRGGPDGGDGGGGGDVVIRADENVGSLSNLIGHKFWNAGRGLNGEGSLRTGRDGADVEILVPPGTLVRDTERGHVLKDLAQHGDVLVIAKGGKGGRGNKHFATSTNRVPREAEPGLPGESRTVTLELKLIADVGLIGKPNAGKSTLLSRLSRANPEIADYPFTTKYPNLGIVRSGEDRSFVMADIPGLIEGAHAGVGLGHEFLRHVERTKLLVHLVEPQPMDGSDPIDNYRQIREELRLYTAPTMVQETPLHERPEILVVTKCELPDAQTAAEFLHEVTGLPVMQISAVTGKGLPQLVAEIARRLEAIEHPEAV